MGKKILGKPKSEKEAEEMLRLLSGKEHKVTTGITIKSNKNEKNFFDSTKVVFKVLTEKEIKYYVKNYKPFDKAGSYAIQEWIGLIGIKKIIGSYFNVMGLPTEKLYSELIKFCYEKINIFWALFPILLLIFLLTLNVIIFSDDATSGANQIALILSAMFASAISLNYGYSWKSLQDGIIKSISSA